MKNFFKNRGIFSLIVVIVILGALVGFLNVSKTGAKLVENVAEVILTPVQKVFTRIGQGFSEFLGYFSDIDELREENKKLKDEKAELENEIREIEASKKENEELRKLLALKSAAPEFDLEAAEIVARDPSNWYNIITVDKGTADGIAVNQPVISSGKTLVGRVSDVGSTWAKITTVTDPEHGAGAEILRTADLGIVEGDGGLLKDGNCRMSFISKNANIAAGDIIITSGLGGIYPKGLLIGKVMELRTDIQGISQYAVVKPEADIEALHTVFIIKSIDEE